MYVYVCMCISLSLSLYIYIHTHICTYMYTYSCDVMLHYIILYSTPLSAPIDRRRAESYTDAPRIAS